jgi:hypothetical protein
MEKRESPFCQVMKGKKKKRASWAQVESAGRGRAFVFQVPLELTLPYGRAGPGSSHPMNDWGGAWAVPSQVKVVWPIPRQPT